MARKKKRARPSGGHRQPSRAQKNNSLAKLSIPRSKRANKPATTRFNFSKLSLRSQSFYNRALDALKLMRRGSTFSKASRKASLDSRTAKKYLSDVLVHEGGRRFHARKTDRKPARVNLFTEQGILRVVVRGLKQRSLAGWHYHAVKHYARTGDTSLLKEFEGLKLGNHELITDPKVLDRILDKFDVDDEFEIYSDPAEVLE